MDGIYGYLGLTLVIRDPRQIKIKMEYLPFFKQLAGIPADAVEDLGHCMKETEQRFSLKKVISYSPIGTPG